MTLWEILLIAFGVSLDSMAVSAAGSVCPGKFSKRHCAFNAALFFGGFQFIMPVAGFFAAGFLTGIVAEFDHYVAFLLLLFVGVKMIHDALKNSDDPESCPVGEFFSAGNMVVPAVATSMDALAVGAGIAFSGNQVWFPAIAMGIVTGIMSALSVFAGKKIVEKFGSGKIGAAGGVAIIIVGVKILLEHLLK